MRKRGTTFPGTIFAVLMLAIMFCNPRPAVAASDAEIIRGFNLTVFGSEYSPFGFQADYIRKYRGPVRFYLHNMSRIDRRPAARRFINSLHGSIQNLRTGVVSNQAQANFHVYLVDRRDYERVVRERVYRGSTTHTLGRCIVRSVFTRTGIQRSDAVIVSDEGEALFQRCLIEEILQGLGPLNEHPSLRESVFNDTTRHTSFTRFDRIILNMLYDRRISTGATRQSVQPLLPAVLADVKRRLR